MRRVTSERRDKYGIEGAVTDFGNQFALGDRELRVAHSKGDRKALNETIVNGFVKMNKHFRGDKVLRIDDAWPERFKIICEGFDHLLNHIRQRLANKFWRHQFSLNRFYIETMLLFKRVKKSEFVREKAV